MPSSSSSRQADERATSAGRRGVRSSSAAAAKRAAAIRSRTAMWLAEPQPVGARHRHAALLAARGSAAAKPRRACAPAPGCRRRCQSRPSSSPLARPIAATVAAIARGELVPAACAARARRPAAPRPPAVILVVGRDDRATARRSPGAGRHAPRGVVRDRRILERDPVQSRRLDEHRVDRPSSSAFGGARTRPRQPHVAAKLQLGARGPSPSNAGRSPRILAGSAPWKPKIDCLRRRPRRSCAACRRARRARRRNPPVSARTISHCSGLVSCASSTSTWSIRRSSLYAPTARRRRARAAQRRGDQIVEIDRPSRSLASSPASAKRRPSDSARSCARPRRAAPCASRNRARGTHHSAMRSRRRIALEDCCVRAVLAACRSSLLSRCRR